MVASVVVTYLGVFVVHVILMVPMILFEPVGLVLLILPVILVPVPYYFSKAFHFI
jgi:hypothetical protein